jgi:predicted metal-dependent hydrolase|tara:strand:- start:5692 stop:6120 length:429 start_codon:yes stop_codon:yes gene_type:complete
MISFLVLFLINILILLNTREPKELLEVKERYRTLREHLKKTNNKKFAVLVTPIPITGLKKMTGTVGYNVNKGADITLCLDGDANEIMHVLIHELTHSTVPEWDHSKNFWEQFTELRGICESIGVYTRLADKTKFCGQYIQDK